MERAKAEPPKGSEIFASGEEEVQLHFACELGGRSQRESVDVTWNDLFATLAPLMIDGAPELRLKQKLGEFYRNRVFDNKRVVVYDEYIRDEDFQKVKVQFRALGLITRDDQRPDKPNSGTYWTPYGDITLTQVAAVRSSRVPISR